MASVTLEKVKKDYGVVRVLNEVDLKIADGEFVVLVGPSGCGKSTLLRMIAGLEEVSGGDIRIGERVVNDVAPKDRDIAMVFQSYALYPHMNVSSNMGFSLMLRKADKTSIETRVDGAAKRLGLEPLLERLPRQLSGGQRQRVAMGRAIVRDPQVFLFDEPLSNLDAKLRTHMRTEIKALHQQLKTTSIYVTHDQTEAMTMADRIVVMHNGNVQQVGAPLELYDKPANIFVAGFIGSPAMNFLQATMVRQNIGQALFTDGQKLRLPDGLPLQEGASLTLGVRPEDIRIVDDGPLKAEVEVVEPLGMSTQYYVRVAGEQLRIYAIGRPGLAPGQTVRLAVEPAVQHIFDPESGNRVEAG
ncbi:MULTISPECIES: ABC transporter ATP-binding protein [Phyllobacteriaceae]|jgi:multiple sugar transport system ATP-binding protein|uniref:Glycerol-3-phosphate ABC transporter ATP-binding protein n=2 Tax=Pseudomonadota TaxID=1224 RepID=A0A1C2DSI5_9HYPH|nr:MULTISPECIES: sn-glycerol-3-phosphate ABC transporter ATP-binding protein UgpC [Mesorhizobium]MBN9236184.1 sn-glycerol-3-phosphate ABC transporter ATP-binding protein UgpC [Mesorhizobium sp.]MDQ0327918.1 multiple sugar transport system ATP-binding protein [Mesorhizobium sp. YL-MeA3-2017]OCX17714.1 glycerol-3-phosphate ABC transporter ATP-binding protein [Mesorhizobium hungaricum]